MRPFSRCLLTSALAHIAILAIPLHTPSGIRYPPPPLLEARLILPEKPGTAIDEFQGRSPPAGNAYIATIPERMPIEIGPSPQESPVLLTQAAYLPADTLTRRPEPLRDWDELAWQLPPQANGTLVLELYISSAGVVDRVETLHSSSDELTDWATKRLFQGAAFSPGEFAGKPVATVMRIELDLSAIRD